MIEQRQIIPPERQLPEFVRVARVVPLVMVPPNILIPKNSDHSVDLDKISFVRLVLIQKQNLGPSANLLIFPGGKIENGETGSEACLRELYEETGLTAKHKLLEKISSRFVRIPNGRYTPRNEEYWVLPLPWVVPSTSLQDAKVSGVIQCSWDELNALRQDPNSNLLDSYKDPRSFEIPSSSESCQTDVIFSEIYEQVLSYEEKIKTAFKNKLKSLRKRDKTFDLEGKSLEYLAYLAVFLEENWNNLPDNFQRPFLFIDILQANEINLDFLSLLLEEDLINFARTDNPELSTFYKAFINDLLKGNQTVNQSGFCYSFLSYIRELLKKEIPDADVFWQNTIFDNQNPLNPYDHLRLATINCLYESIRRFMNKTLFNIINNNVNEQNVEFDWVKNLILVNLVVNYLINTWELKLETDLEKANAESLVLSAKSFVSLIRKILDRGLNSINEQVNDILRCAIVLPEEKIKDLILGLIDFIKKELPESQIEIIHIKVDGMEHLANEIFEELRGRFVVFVSGKSSVESKASNPLFRWVKFCLKVNGEVFEVQIFPSVIDKEEKIKDDSNYKIRSILSANGRGLPLARLILPVDKYIELLARFGLYTRQD